MPFFLGMDITRIPSRPGVYQFFGKTGEILYIGKAKDLAKRVKSYFGTSIKDPKTAKLISEVHDVSVIVVQSEVDALLLESRMIREQKPRFNIDLRDSIRYAYIKITRERYPRIISARQKSQSGEYFGPFTDGTIRAEAVSVLNAVYALRTCRTLPKKACLQHFIGKCSAPCIGKITEKDYQARIEQARRCLLGKTSDVISQIESQMLGAAKQQAFEAAIDFRNRIKALRELHQKQQPAAFGEKDAIIMHAYYARDGHCIAGVMAIEGGILKPPTFFRLPGYPDVCSEFLKQYVQTRHLPPMIVLGYPVEDRAALEAFFSHVSGRGVRVIAPKRGKYAGLLSVLLENLVLEDQEENPALRNLRDCLNLAGLPRRIEGFDISHLYGRGAVASCVVFEDGVPKSKEYRRFRIKTVMGQDDPAMIAEVVLRRYRRLLAEAGKLPQLVLIDGGNTQLHAAVQALQGLGLKIPAVGLAKKQEELYVPGLNNPIQLGAGNPARMLLEHIRNEAHRFALAYQKKMRFEKEAR